MEKAGQSAMLERIKSIISGSRHREKRFEDDADEAEYLSDGWTRWDGWITNFTTICAVVGATVLMCLIMWGIAASIVWLMGW